MINNKNDIEALPGADDSYSDAVFSPVNDLIAATSWDGHLRIWDVMTNGSVISKLSQKHESPVLSAAWSNDGFKVFSSGADKTIRALDLNSGQSINFGSHDQPISKLKWMNTSNAQALVSGSWDKILKYWDLRSPNPVASLALPERVYAMDICQDLLVVATAERHICIINLSNPTVIYRDIPSPLKWQTRTVSCYPNAIGFAVGSIEGRVGLQWIDEKSHHLNFAFKCHREGNNAYAVNAISFHPLYGSFSTAGSDGFIHYWDKESKQRLESSNSFASPITTTCFNRNGSLFAYAIGYDWSKGHEFPHSSGQKLMIHQTQDMEIKPKIQSSTMRRR